MPKKPALRVAADGSAHWINWAKTATASPTAVFRPGNPSEIADAVTESANRNLCVRALGSGHSFTDIAASEGAVLDLSGWRGIESADVDSGRVAVRSGTTLRELNTALDALGLAMSNLGDIDAQTIAGAISTGTHGTGMTLGGLATQVEALDVIQADGSTVSYSAGQNPELLAAAAVGLGALGVISVVHLRCEPAFLLSADERPQPLDEVLDQVGQLAAANDHFEFYWFPYGRNALVKRNNRLPADAAAKPLSAARRFLEYQVLENGVLELLCRTGRAIPRLVAPLNKLASSAVSPRTYSDRSHRVFVTERSVRFVESEYAIPREALPDVLTELRARVPRLPHPVMLPVEVRMAAADDIWLSTAYQRESAYLAVHQYLGMPYREYFELFESVAGAVGGRPHWGKKHSLGAAELRERYPRFDDFVRMREKVDPDRRFTNAYLDRVLGY